MYFSRVTINPYTDPAQLAKLACGDGYREHQAVWRLFDDDPQAERDFLYRHHVENGRSKYYVLSERLPQDESGVWLIDPPKPYDPQLKAGQRLFFTLRANPVVTLKTADGKRQRHDVVMHKLTALGYRKTPDGRRTPHSEREHYFHDLVEETCHAWLEKRAADNGFAFLPANVQVSAYSQERTAVKGIRYSTVDFQGLLQITDPQRFKAMLFKGLGPSKAFGCGLMLVRRAA